MRVFVLISTIDEGICGVPGMLLPKREGVEYVVSWQDSGGGTAGHSTHGREEGIEASRLPAQSQKAETMLRERGDVTLTRMEGRGLSRNRNHAIETMLGLLKHPLEDAICVIADDDERLMPEAFERLRAIYERYPKMDGALMRLRSRVDGEYFKPYPKELTIYGRHPRSYYVCSWEMTFRTRVWQAGIRFDERFGLGAKELCAGEEDVLLTDMLRKGLKVLIVPEDIGYTDPLTTGTQVLDERVLRSKGALYGYQYGYMKAVLRGLREAVSLGVRNRSNPLPLLREIHYGINYIRS